MSISDLPDELLVEIGERSSLPSLIRLARTCHHYYDLLSGIMSSRLNELPWRIAIEYGSEYDETRIHEAWIYVGYFPIFWSENCYKEACSECDYNVFPRGSRCIGDNGKIYKTVVTGVGGPIIHKIFQEYPTAGLVPVWRDERIVDIELVDYCSSDSCVAAEIGIGRLRELGPEQKPINWDRLFQLKHQRILPDRTIRYFKRISKGYYYDQ